MNSEKTNLTPQQKLLAERMQNISERCYYAGWMTNLEYVLWHSLINGPRPYGIDDVTQNDIDSLKALSSIANCWIIFHDLTEETPIDIDTWKSKYEMDIINNPDLIIG